MSNADQRQNLRPKKITKFLRNAVNVMVEAVLLNAAVIVAYTVLLHFTKAGWHLFSQTQVGQTYAQIHDYNHRMTAAVFNQDLVTLSVQMVLTSFVICFITAAICQVLYLSRYLYSPRGLLGSCIFWGLPLTMLVALYSQHAYGYKQIDLAFSVALVPTMMVFMSCFKYADRVLPEMGDIIRMMKEKDKESPFDTRGVR